jgi:predicted ATP-grasp superfamily ATP-dependent carboligase
VSLRPFIAFHDPWDALALGRLLDAPVATFGGERQRAAFAAAGLEATLVEPPEELQTLALLDDPRVRAAVREQPSLLVCFKPSARLEARAGELGARLAHNPARLAQGLENKLALAGLAEEAGVAIPAQLSASPGRTSWQEITCQLGGDLVVQPPRGFAGRKTWRVRDADEWQAIVDQLGRRTARIAEWREGRPGTVNAVVDASGQVLVTAPIVQVTGDPRLTPYRLGSCGNDFTWRPAPHPGALAEAAAERFGPVLAARGYRGHFGLDFVFDGHELLVIEINARLTASFGLYASRQRRLLDAHLAALRGEAIEAGRLPPIEGGQLIRLNTSESAAASPDRPGLWPHPRAQVDPGGRLARAPSNGVVVDEAGDVSPALLRALA